MKIASWNVNGIRAAAKTHFFNWFDAVGADIICLQEIKATPEQLDDSLKHPFGYQSYWNPAQKPGYSGTAIYTRTEPLEVRMGFLRPDSADFDSEGRILIAEYPTFTLINAYFPNSQREHTRLPYKLAFCEAMLKFCQERVAQGKNIVLCGDYNIAHQEIDLRNPKTNKDNAGFLPQERDWMTQFLNAGFVDTFREFEKGGGHYTWWSYRPGVREKNVGWRIDYHCINEGLKDRLKASTIQCEVKGSDHCPVILELKD